MEPQPRHSSEDTPELLESEDDGESGADSFFTDDELTYQEGVDPAEELSYLLLYVAVKNTFEGKTIHVPKPHRSFVCKS